MKNYRLKKIVSGKFIFVVGVFLLVISVLSSLPKITYAASTIPIVPTIPAPTTDCSTTLCQQLYTAENNAAQWFNELVGPYNIAVNSNNTATINTLQPYIDQAQAAFTAFTGEAAQLGGPPITDTTINATPNAAQIVAAAVADAQQIQNIEAQGASAIGTTPGALQNAGVLAAQSASCSLYPSSFNAYSCATYITAWIATQVLSWCAYFMGLAAIVLDGAIGYTILSMSSFVNGATGINVGWQMIRDVSNLILIFLLLYVAIKTILGLAGGQTKKLIVNIIIFALLVNFSLFFTKVIIDASNILTAGFFSLSVGTGASANDFAGKFIADLGLSGLLTGTNALANQQFTNIVIIGLGGSIFFILGTITFLIVAVLLCVRFVALILLLILSPIGYIGSVLPQLNKYAKKWWDTLIAQCAFAPIYMILIYLVLVLAGNLASAHGTSGQQLANDLIPSGMAGAAGPNPSATNLFINFIIIIGFMNMATIIATSVASGAGGLTATVADWGKRTVNKTRAGLVQAPVRGTVGYGARIADERLSNTAIGNTRAVRAVRSVTTESLAKAKFGTSQSSADIAKANKAAREQYAKKREDAATKTGNKTADKITEVDTLRNSQLTSQRANIATRKGKMDEIDKTLADMTGTSGDIMAAETLINEAQKKFNAATTPEARASAQEELLEGNKQLKEVEKRRDAAISANSALQPLKDERDGYEKANNNSEKEIENITGRMGTAAINEERKVIVNSAMQAEVDRQKKMKRRWKTTLVAAGSVGVGVATGAGLATVGAAGVAGAGIVLAPVVAGAMLGQYLIKKASGPGGSGTAARNEAIKKLEDRVKKGKSTKETLEELIKDTGVEFGGGAGTGSGEAGKAK